VREDDKVRMRKDEKVRERKENEKVKEGWERGGEGVRK